MNPVRNDYKLPFLNEINTKFMEINSNRDKPSTASTSRLHPDGFVNQIEQLEQTANSCGENPQRGVLRFVPFNVLSCNKVINLKYAFRETSSPDERHKKRVQFAAEVSGDESKENGHTSTSSNASDSPRSEQQPQKPTISAFEVRSIEANNVDDDDDEEDNEPRTQILGRNEVYNDPRQKRLNEQAKSLKPVVSFFILCMRSVNLLDFPITLSKTVVFLARRCKLELSR